MTSTLRDGDRFRLIRTGKPTIVVTVKEVIPGKADRVRVRADGKNLTVRRSQLAPFFDPPDIIRTIGMLDRILSEMMILAKTNLDAADIQTMKHHAEDMIGCGTKVLELLKGKDAQS